MCSCSEGDDGSQAGWKICMDRSRKEGRDDVSYADDDRG